MTPTPDHICFTYGSLMCHDIMTAVCGTAVPPGQTATLRDYSRHPVHAEEYPGIQTCPGALVEGVLYAGVSELALERLDAFEGSQYRRDAVTVESADGHKLSAWVYVFRPEHCHLLLPGDWDHEAFLANGKARFLAQYLGFSRL